jgi:CrcB protein
LNLQRSFVISHPERVTRFLLICLGGAVGTGCRYLTSVWAASAFGTTFPFGTLIVNIVGSFLLGFLMHLGTTSELMSDTMRLALTSGVMGGFTTYSTFNYETTSYLRQGSFAMASLNMTVTLAGCLIAGFAGMALGRFIVGR